MALARGDGAHVDSGLGGVPHRLPDLIWIKWSARDWAKLAAMTSLSHFDLLVQAAAAQPQPQRLLFVFAGAELVPDATAAQRERFEAGQEAV